MSAHPAVTAALTLAAVLLFVGLACCVMWVFEATAPRGRHAATRRRPPTAPAPSTQDEPTVDERFRALVSSIKEETP